MVFKKIEVFGFKSFADKLEVDFSGGVTCIVGPNGCGKSNVSDAVRWVLGEQSSKVLRGTSMQDVIFKGTEKRSQLGYCEVSLHFDNAQKTFPVDFGEVVISRKLYRSGESEYFINRQPARLKDITGILHDSGIDRDGLTIISQGQVGEIINAKPENRRGIFEEAVGIAKFKSRKVEAERKLERTAADLQRVNDVINEIGRGLGPLLRQAEAAEKYIALRDRLKLLEVNAYIRQYDGAAENKERLQTELNRVSEELQSKQTQMSEAMESGSAGLDEIEQIDKRQQTAQEMVLQLSLGLERHSGEKKLVQEKLELLGEQDVSVKTEIAVLQSQLEDERAKQERGKLRLEELKNKQESLNEQLLEASEVLSEKSGVETTLSALRIEKAQAEARKKTIENLIESGEGYKFSVRKIIEAKSKDNQIEKEVVGVLAQLLVVPQELEAAIEVALGAAAQNIVTHDEDGAKRMVDFLRRNNWGRATFLPITSTRARVFSMEEDKALSDSCVIGVASELVDFPEEIARVVNALLGRVVIVDTLDNAIALAKRTKNAFKIVTPDGDVIETRGSITGGSKNALNNNLWHTNSLAAVEEQIADIDEKIAELTEDGSAETARDTVTSLKVKIAGTEGDLYATETMLAGMVNTLLLMEKNIEEKSSALGAINKNMKMAKDLEADADEEKLYYEAVRRLEMAKEELDGFEGRKQKLRERITECDRLRTELSNEIADLTQHYYKTESDRARIDVDIEQMQQRIDEEYGLNYSSCFEFKTEEFDMEAALPEIAGLKRSITRLGPVNLDAVEDCKESKARFDNYSEQVADLTSAKADLEKLIGELSAEMEGRFKRDFEIINHNFGIVFKELFGGGNARLVLTDPGDCLGSGIDIVAEPPGKKLQNITLLSGGEKALTAIAILFAILKLRPMPFCLLDEIEAALDEANVARFASYLQKFSATTQFIVITHRKPTMELADNLYGVTMEEKGVSKLVSVKLEGWQTA